MQVTLIKPLNIIILFFLLGIGNVLAQNTFWVTKAGNDSNNCTNATEVVSTNNDIDPNAFYVDKDHISTSNNTNTNDGSKELPWKTIQHGVNQLTEGQRLYVRESIEPYFEPYRASGASQGGITITVSGTEANPIIIEGYPNERPVINQQRGMSYLRAEDGTKDDLDASKVLSGVYFFRDASNIILRNFEITQTATGVLFGNGSESKNVIIENMHIHHLYGEDNIGGITLSHADNIIVRNNIIHDTYDIRNPSGNPYTDEIYAMHSGIHGFQPGNCIIENNLIYNVAKGVYQKTPDSDGKDSNTVRRNIFYNISDEAFFMGAGVTAAFNGKFYENIVYDARTGVRTKLYETSSQSDGILIYNNTFHNVESIASFRGHTGIEFYNNIISNSSSVNFSTSFIPSGSNINEITYLDNNLYYNHANKWMLKRSAPDFEQWTNLSDWQLALSVDQGTGLINNPDTSSFEDDPLFVDIPNKDFHLETKSPAVGKGRNGETLGAYGLGAIVIGVNINQSDVNLIFKNSFE